MAKWLLPGSFDSTQWKGTRQRLIVAGRQIFTHAQLQRLLGSLLGHTAVDAGLAAEQLLSAQHDC